MLSVFASRVTSVEVALSRVRGVFTVYTDSVRVEG